jgi:hypothetical protein
MKATRKTHPITIIPSGFGHNKITVTFRGKEYSTHTSNTRATDVVNDDQYERNKRYSCARAHSDLLDEIKRANNLR